MTITIDVIVMMLGVVVFVGIVGIVVCMFSFIGFVIIIEDIL